MPRKQKPAALPAALWQMDEVMAFLHLSRAQVNRLMKHDGLPCIHLGGSLRFDPRAVDSWLQQRQQKAV